MKNIFFRIVNSFVRKKVYILTYILTYLLYLLIYLLHNKSDLLLWDCDEKICQVIKFSCPADISVSRKVEYEVAAYAPLIRNLQIMYKDYYFKMLPVVVGTLGTITNATKESLQGMKFSKTEINKLSRKLQNNSVRGMVKICKTFMKFSES